MDVADALALIRPATGFAYNAGTADARSQAFDAVVARKLAAMEPQWREAVQAAGVTRPAIAKEVPGQDTWQTLGLPDLRQMPPIGLAPELMAAPQTAEEAVELLRQALGVTAGGHRLVDTPAGKVGILDRLLAHIVEKRSDARERFGHFVLPTLEAPDEVWATAYDDDTTRRRYIKMFAGSKCDVAVIVQEQADGSVLWNLLPRERKRMNNLRVGTRIYHAGESN